LHSATQLLFVGKLTLASGATLALPVLTNYASPTTGKLSDIVYLVQTGATVSVHKGVFTGAGSGTSSGVQMSGGTFTDDGSLSLGGVQSFLADDTPTNIGPGLGQSVFVMTGGTATVGSLTTLSDSAHVTISHAAFATGMLQVYNTAALIV